jgi:hypothetical protein
MTDSGSTFSATFVGKKQDRLCLNGLWRPDHWSYARSEVIGPGEMSAHRFLDSPHVTPEEILRTAANRTASAYAGRRIVAAQDTTEINFSGRSCGRQGLGPAGDGKTPGFFRHAMVAVDVEDEAVLGVVHARVWTRPTTQTAATRPRAIEDKESFRWIEGSTVAGERLRRAAQVIIVGDRESDIYSQFARTPPGAELIVRAAQNRKLDNDELLFAAPSDWRELHGNQCSPASTRRSPARRLRGREGWSGAHRQAAQRS